MQEYTSGFKLFGHPTRLRILRLLLDAGDELCVCEIVDVMIESQFNVSRNLRKLEEGGLVRCSRKGKWSMYRINDNLDPFQVQLLQAVQKIPADYFAGEKRRLHERLALRVDGACVVGINPPTQEVNEK